MNKKNKNQTWQKKARFSINRDSFPSFVLKMPRPATLLALGLATLRCLIFQGHALAQYYQDQPTFTQAGSGNSLVTASGTSSDGSVHVTITSTSITADQPLALQISFTDQAGRPIPYEHYGIRAQQMVGNGVLLLSNESSIAVNGKDIQVTDSLQNVSPVNFQVQLQGSGAPDTSITEWRGPNEIVSITIGQQYSSHTAVSEAPPDSEEVVTIPFGAYDPNFNTAAPNWYQPAVVTIQVNQSVTWINQDKEVHTVTSGVSAGRAGLIGNSVGRPDGIFDSSQIGIGKSWTHKFTRPGTFEYFCTIHPWMEGYVIVKEAQPVPTDAQGNKITKFPIVRLTPDRAYELDLDWEPHYITTGQQITFIYQVYDNIRFEAIPAHYVFTINQNGQQLYKVDDSTQFGGAYQYFRFDNPGPVTFEFDDIAHTGQSAQYSTIVAPGNPSDMNDDNAPMVEPARNLELTWWLMPLFFVPCGGAVAAIYIIKRKSKREDPTRPVQEKRGDGGSQKRTPI